MILGRHSVHYPNTISTTGLQELVELKQIINFHRPSPLELNLSNLYQSRDSSGQVGILRASSDGLSS